MKVSEGGGVEIEEGNNDVLEMPFRQAMDMITTGEFEGPKTIMPLQLIKLYNPI